MATSDDRELRGFLRGIVKAEADEVATGSEVPAPAADQRLAAALVTKYGAPRSRRRPAWRAAAAGLGAAALLGIVFVAQPWAPKPDPWPDYKLTVRTDDRVLGHDPTAALPLTLSPDGALTITLRPQHATPHRPTTKVFVRSAGQYTEWPVELECSPKGVCILSQPRSSLPALPGGDIELVFVLSRDALPDGKALQAQLAAQATACGDGCQIVRQSLTNRGS